jgi:hypothetical protein
MNKMLASVFALGVMATAAGCGGGIPGASCAFDRGETASAVSGDAKAFVDAAMDLKKATDKLETDWNAEIASLAKDLGTDPSEDAVLLKIKSNVVELKAKGSCEVKFEAKASAGASGSAGGAAGSGGASGGASGQAYAKAEVKFEAKCKAEASVKANLDVTMPAIQKHFPVLLGIAGEYAALGPKVKDTMAAGDKLVSSVKDVQVLQEVQCAVKAVTNIKVEARVSFSVKASASAQGEASSG